MIKPQNLCLQRPFPKKKWQSENPEWASVCSQTLAGLFIITIMLAMATTMTATMTTTINLPQVDLRDPWQTTTSMFWTKPLCDFPRQLSVIQKIISRWLSAIRLIVPKLLKSIPVQVHSQSLWSYTCLPALHQRLNKTICFERFSKTKVFSIITKY